jgi:hypothetical protein
MQSNATYFAKPNKNNIPDDMVSSGTYFGKAGADDMESNATYFAKGGGNNADMESNATYI